MKHLVCPCEKERYCDIQCQKKHWKIIHSAVCEYKKGLKNTASSSQNNSRQSVPSHSRDKPDTSAPCHDKPVKSIPSFQKSDKNRLNKSDGQKVSSDTAFAKPNTSQSSPILESVVSAANPDLELSKPRNKKGQFKTTQVINCKALPSDRALALKGINIVNYNFVGTRQQQGAKVFEKQP